MTALYQRRVGSCLDHHRRTLQARTVSDALTEVIAALADAARHGDGRPEVWRLAAMRTSQLLAMLNVGAASLGEPLPAASVELIEELRAWAVTMGAEALHAGNQIHRRADAVAERSGSDLLPPPGPERGTPGGRANVAAGLAPRAIPPRPVPKAEPARGARLTGQAPEAPVPLTDEQRAALFRLGRAGGRQHRDTLRRHTLLELLRARLVAPEVHEQVQITSRGLRSLAATVLRRT
jgi:hypothetical protein